MPIISYQFNYLAFILCILTKVVHSLPHDKCFEKFDGRDCHQPPKQVFYYYKEGSRCEMKTWRGCPSLNMFDDEFACSHHCIGKLWRRGSGEEGFGHSESEEIDPCSQTLDTADCGLEPQEVYTFQGGICETENWYGCTSHNKFEDEASCIKACVTTVAEWKEELNSLDLPEIEDIGTILDDVINEADRIPLHLSVVEHDTETTSEPETTPEPEITPEPETTPEPEITPEPETESTPEPETKDESKSSSGEGPIAQGSIEEVVT